MSELQRVNEACDVVSVDQVGGVRTRFKVNAVWSTISMGEPRRQESAPGELVTTLASCFPRRLTVRSGQRQARQAANVGNPKDGVV